MEKIYSRKLIKVYKIGKIKLSILFILILIIFSIVFYIRIAIPVIEASCRNVAYSKVTNIVTNDTKEVMKEYSYNDLIIAEKNNNGEINVLKMNVIAINELIAKLTQNIQNDIDKEERSKVFINMGTISGISYFNFIGPKFEIEFETAGDSKIEIKSEFESKGINQTIHKIYADIDGYIKIITPFGNYEENMKSKVLLTESVIIGEVPNNYYNLK